jgi:hypothetical protein
MGRVPCGTRPMSLPTTDGRLLRYTLLLGLVIATEIHTFAQLGHTPFRRFL